MASQNFLLGLLSGNPQQNGQNGHTGYHTEDSVMAMLQGGHAYPQQHPQHQQMHHPQQMQQMQQMQMMGGTRIPLDSLFHAGMAREQQPIGQQHHSLHQQQPQQPPQPAAAAFNFVSPFVMAKMNEALPAAPAAGPTAVPEPPTFKTAQTGPLSSTVTPTTGPPAQGAKLPHKDMMVTKVDCQPLHVSSEVITVINNKLEYSPGPIIAVSEQFICYSVKGDKIRFIHQESGKMDLIKGVHNSTIHSLQLVSNPNNSSECLLASLSTDAMAITRIEFNEEGLHCTHLVKIESQQGIVVHLHAHLFGEFVLAQGPTVLHGKVSEVLVDGLQALLSSSTSTTIQVSSQAVSLAHAQDGSAVAVASVDGRVSVVHVQQNALKVVRSWQIAPANSITAIHFVSGPGFIDSALLVVSNQASRFSLVDLGRGIVVKTLSFAGTTDFRAYQCWNDLLLVSNNDEQNMAVVKMHLPAVHPSHANTLKTIQLCMSDVALVEGKSVAFDTVTAIATNEPVVSLAVVGEAQDLAVYAVQTKSIKHYKVPLKALTDLLKGESTFSGSFRPVSPFRPPSQAPTKERQSSPQPPQEVARPPSPKRSCPEETEPVHAQPRPVMPVNLGEMEDRIVAKLFAKLEEREAQAAQKTQTTLETTLAKQFSSLLSKQITKTVSESSFNEVLVHSMKPSVESLMRSVFKEVFVPGMQRAVREMFSQINVALDQGVQQAFSQYKQGDDGPFVTKDMFDTYMNQFQQTLLTALSEQRLNEVEASEAGRRSTAMTPNGGMSEADVKYELTKLMDEHNYEAAFVKALGTGDVQFVVYLCGKVKTKDIFPVEGPLLSQPVLLSFVHQLASDLSRHTSLKLIWLQEALMHLKPEDVNIAQHVPRVLSAMRKKLEDCAVVVAQDPQSTRLCRMVSLIVNGML